MKKLLIGISLLFLVGCGYNSEECYDTVKKKYPNAEVIRLPETKFNFLVKELDGTIRLVRTYNHIDTNITTDVILFK